MANWTKNEPIGSTSRRKWELEDRTSLNNLKYHIAAEGCSETQYDLAKQLLERSVATKADNQSQQAVHWLLCATQQGHREASKLLRKCYLEHRGITGENEAEVRCCLTMTPGELAARRAAREIFACLANGSEHITPKQLERKMRAIYNLQKKRRRPGHLPDSTSEEDDEEEEEAAAAEIHVKDGVTDASVVRNGRARSRHLSQQSRANFENNQQNNRLITEANLVSAAVNYAAGRLPTVTRELTLSIPHPASLDHVPCFHRLFFHPIIFFTLLYHRFISFIATIPNTLPPSVRLLGIFAIYCLFSTEKLSVLLPVVLYYLSLSIMIWSTCKMLKSKHDFIDFRIWSGLFLSYGDNNIEADVSEQRFLRNNMSPYLCYFCAFATNLLMSPLLASEWLPYSEITITSCIFVFTTLIAFMYSATSEPFPDFWVLVSFGINVLAKYPYEMDEVVTTGWRFLDLKAPTFCSFVIGNGIEFCLNCRTALYLLIPGFLIKLAKRSDWHGIYTHLIPHCVTLSWLQLCIMASQRATMFGVMRATLGLAGILLFLPLFGIVSLLIPVFVAIEWLGFVEPSVRLGSTLIVLSLALICSCLLAANRLTQKYVTSIQLLLGLVAACVLTLPYMTSNFKHSTDLPNLGHVSAHANGVNTEESIIIANYEHLDWQRFYALCGPTSWEQHVNKISTQMRCTHFEGMTVVWEGSVAEVHILRVHNNVAKLINKYVPSWLDNTLRCLIGKKVELDCNEDPVVDKNHCEKLQQQLKHKCSLQKWSTYEYEVRIHISNGGLLSKPAEVILQASDKFGNFTRRLIAGDRLRFAGTLINSRSFASGEEQSCLLGSALRTHVQLTAVECKVCRDKTNVAVGIDRSHTGKSLVDARLRDLKRGIKYLLNVLFNPLITFK